MKAKLVVAIVLVLLVVLVVSAVAMAAVSQATIDAIIEDAADGTIDGTWTAAQINAALSYIEDNPLYQQYSEYRGVLEDYLASLQAPGEEGGELAFTGGEVILLLGAGAGLIGSGALLRRRRS